MARNSDKPKRKVSRREPIPMNAKKPASAPTTLVVDDDPEHQKGQLKKIGGSKSDDWNNIIAHQAMQALWVKNSSPEDMNKQQVATVMALIGIAPKDELEGMMAAQLVACHNAAMECHRRAMLPEQTFEGRSEGLSQANKLSRTYATLLEALNRHRGKGQQKVTVEHVHVHAGGQAVVGVVEPQGGGDRAKSEDQHHEKSIAYAPEPALPCPDPTRDALPVACYGEGAL